MDSGLCQQASAVWMVRPAAFTFNAETAGTNSFQHAESGADVHDQVVQEWEGVVDTLTSHGVVVHSTSSLDREAPDSLFPNNWFSTHHDGSIVLYPMLALNRRRERQSPVLQQLAALFGERRYKDFSHHEEDGVFLEGTGSIVFDHGSRMAYAVESPRTNRKVLEEVCGELGYTPFLFHCNDRNGKPVYHTNVVMNIGEGYAVLCLEGVPDGYSRHQLRASIEHSAKKLVEISLEQMEFFCGNMLQLRNSAGELLTVCSSTSFNALDESQKTLITTNSRFVVVDIPLIEKIGGGGVRCLLAEVFLEK